MGIKSIRIQNFKSIRDSGEIALRPLNVLIGANGTGKSNFISFSVSYTKHKSAQPHVPERAYP